MFSHFLFILLCTPNTRDAVRVEVRGHLVRVSALHHVCGSWEAKLGRQGWCFYPLNHVTGPEHYI